MLLDWAVAEPVRAAELLPMVQDSWQQAVAIGENPLLPDTVAAAVATWPATTWPCSTSRWASRKATRMAGAGRRETMRRQ